jgi:hypothetical protein
MKLLVAAALCAAQLAGTANAAGFEADRSVVAQQRGTFAGARLRVPFGGRDAGHARASLGFAPVARTRLGSGAERLRFGEGVELGLRANEPVELRLGGASLASRLSAVPEEEARRRQDKTGKVILKGVAVAAIVGVAVIGGLYLAIQVACAGERCDDD